MVNGPEGDVFDDANPATWVLINSAYETFQDALVDAGADCTYKAQVILTDLTGVNTVDPAAEVELSFTGYWNGVTTTATPALPAGLIEPDRIWSRPSGQTSQTFVPLTGPCTDGLPQCWAPQPTFGAYEWRSNSIFFPAATQSNDIMLRYITYAPAIVDATSPVLILRSIEAIANLTAYKFASSRGGAAAANFKADAQVVIDANINRDIRAKQHKSVRRHAYGRNRGARRGY
jgi:hypothetical protein